MDTSAANDAPQRKKYVSFLLILSIALLISAVFHLGVHLSNESPWAGFVSWRKPIIFAVSFAITNLTLAWVLHLLPHAVRKGWLIAAMFGLGGIVEVSLITLQQWRGVPSHFNTATSFDLGVVIVMGATFLPVILSLFGLTVWSWMSLPRGEALTLGMRIGMVYLLLGQVFGYLVIQKGILLMRMHGSIAALYPAIDSLKFPHAVSLHAVQVLCVIGVLSDRTLQNRKMGHWIVIITSIAILAILGLPFFSGI